MNAVIAALILGFVATAMGVLSLRKYGVAAKARSQAFTFHELRDRLQMLAVEGRIEPKSPVYSFLNFTINLAIRNAGVMKLSELLALSRTIDGKMKSLPSNDVFSEIGNEDAEVQRLAADTFRALSKMLISNDDFTFYLAQAIDLIAHWVKGVTFEGLKRIGRLIPSERGRAVQEARKFQRFGDLLSSSHAV